MSRESFYAKLPTEALHPSEEEMAARLRTPIGYRDEAIDTLEKELRKTLRAAMAAIRVPIAEKENHTLDLSFFSVQSAALAKALAGCDFAYLLAVTLGMQTEQWLHRLSILAPAKHFVADALASAYAEAAADLATAKLSVGKILTPRFSPGYGDLPLSVQPLLLSATEANQHLHITLNESLLMIPQKSITAILGIRSMPSQEKKMKKRFKQALRTSRLYFDGGFGTMVQSRGLPAGTPPELWNLTHPEVIEDIHRAYIEAGSNVITANTFGVNADKYENYEALIRAAIVNARRAAAPYGAYVALDIGPTGKLLKPYGTLDFEDAVALFAKSVRAGAKAGADLCIIETMNDAYETKAAVLAAKENCDLPIIVTNVYDEGGKLMTGADPIAMAAILEGLGVDAIGCNCAFGPDKMMPILKELAEHTSLPLIVQPNAGLPFVKDGKTCFPLSAEDFAKEMVKLSEIGATLLGGCCGTTPDYIRALISATKDLPIAKRTKKTETVVASYTHGVIIDKEPILIGERINPTGKKRVKEALQNRDLTYILEEAAAQVEDGAHVLDVNVGVPGLPEEELLSFVAEAVQEITDAPLQLDSSNPDALAAALRRYNGKALINSVSGKKESMERVFPLVKKYGGVLVALTMDERGIPATAEERVEIAKGILAEGKKYGLSKKDFLFDPLCMTVSADKESANITLKSVNMLTKLGIKTILGVSNVSFGLPERERINAAFYTAALDRGLSAAILNPHSAAMKNAYATHRLLHGLDAGAQDYIAFVSENAPAATVSTAPSALTLTAAIEKGMKEEAERLAKEALLLTAPEVVINEQIIPALTAVGERFEKKTLFLPGLLMSAEAATRAFAAAKDKIPQKTAMNISPIVIATVKGDIHDIGKNIVKVLLESHGFPVLDLGRDVEPAAVLDAVQKSNASLVGLSALMTTTVPAMEETIALLKKKAPDTKIMVGGAVLTPDFAERIGADFYAADGMGAVRVVKEFFKD